MTPRASPALTPAVGPVVDIVLPVYNEAAELESSVRRLHSYLTTAFPLTWQITIVDNASTDRTAAIAARVSDELLGVHWRHLDRKGRGHALREAWTESTSTVVAYMDIDLSTDLDALLPMVAPLASGHSEIAIGSRLARGIGGPRSEARVHLAQLQPHAARDVRHADPRHAVWHQSGARRYCA